MGYVRLHPKLSTEVALRYGRDITQPYAMRRLGKAKALADARAKHSSVAGRISLTVRPNHTQGWRLVMSVEGRVMNVEGRDIPYPQVASALEFGYFNTWANRRLPGMHIMRDTALGG